MCLSKELASLSEFGQDLAAPAACQCHLSPQPVPLCYILPGNGLCQQPFSGGQSACKQAASLYRKGDPLPPLQANPSFPLLAELHSVGSRNGGVHANEARSWED